MGWILFNHFMIFVSVWNFSQPGDAVRMSDRSTPTRLRRHPPSQHEGYARDGTRERSAMRHIAAVVGRRTPTYRSDADARKHDHGTRPWMAVSRIGTDYSRFLNAADLGRLRIQLLASGELSNSATEAPARFRCAPLTGSPPVGCRLQVWR
jgi:hypothetical protein